MRVFFHSQPDRGIYFNLGCRGSQGVSPV